MIIFDKNKSLLRVFAIGLSCTRANITRQITAVDACPILHTSESQASVQGVYKPKNCLIVKYGGSAITCKDQFEIPNYNALENNQRTLG